MLSELHLTLGENGKFKALCFGVSGVTIFVGPNNSGKSLALREIQNLFVDRSVARQLVEDAELIWPTEAEFDDDIEAIQQEYIQISKRAGQEYRDDGNVRVHWIDVPSNNRTNMTLNPQHLRSLIKRRIGKQEVMQTYLRHTVVRLDGRTRFSLVDDRPSGDLQSFPQNMLQELFVEDAKRRKLRDLIYDALGLHFVIDPTAMSSLRIRLADAAPKDDLEEQALDERARRFHARARLIRTTSDGVQAYTGIMCALLSGRYRLLLLDEPEAFLHPPLARKLGYQLANLMKDRKGALFSATHSADFLMGCVQSGAPVTVIRLDYKKGISSARSVDPQSLRRLLHHPLMRSANVISGLFYDAVVVTESENDRVFYSEVFSRVLAQSPSPPSVLFLHAQNKQTVREIVEPLRQFSVPTAAIIDIDIIKENWNETMKAVAVPAMSLPGLSANRTALKDKFAEYKVDMKVGGVMSIPDPPVARAANDLFDALDSYGLFVVRQGELERWLPELKIQGKKTDWVVDAMHLLGDDPGVPGYVHPAQGDVWDFAANVLNWLADPNRKGMPD